MAVEKQKIAPILKAAMDKGADPVYQKTKKGVDTTKLVGVQINTKEKKTYFATANNPYVAKGTELQLHPITTGPLAVKRGYAAETFEAAMSSEKTKHFPSVQSLGQSQITDNANSIQAKELELQRQAEVAKREAQDASKENKGN